MDNPPPGTVLDHTVTKARFYDFYLVSQHVTQGTVTPTRYIVIYDNTDLKTDNIQQLTYKMCHLYYNWSGTVRVPAPCQVIPYKQCVLLNNLRWLSACVKHLDKLYLCGLVLVRAQILGVPQDILQCYS